MNENDKQIVVYDRNKPVEKRPPLELLQLVFLDDMAIALRQIEKSQKKEEFEGEIDSRTLDATDEVQVIDLVDEWPYAPWITAVIINKGPNTIKIGINKAYDWLEIGADQTRTLNHAKADSRIERIYYICDEGETASATVEGQY